MITLAGVAQSVGCCPVNQKVTGSVPFRACTEGNQLMFLTLSFSLPPPFSKKSKVKIKLEINDRLFLRTVLGLRKKLSGSTEFLPPQPCPPEFSLIVICCCSAITFTVNKN